MSKCGHCGGFMWELSQEAPSGSAFKVNFIRCSMCKVPVGVLPFYDIHSKLETMEKQNKTLGETITYSLRVIDDNIRRLFHK